MGNPKECVLARETSSGFLTSAAGGNRVLPASVSRAEWLGNTKGFGLCVNVRGPGLMIYG